MTWNVRTALGVIAIEFAERSVSRIQLGGTKTSSPSPPVFVRKLAADLRKYAKGDRVRFNAPLEPVGTAFQRAVWRALQEIPAGETRSYGWVAARIGRPVASRAVGAACGANPVPVLVPCHRVVRGDGSLGGFSAGLEWKRKLLRLEKRFS